MTVHIIYPFEDFDPYVQPTGPIQVTYPIRDNTWNKYITDPFKQSTTKNMYMHGGIVIRDSFDRANNPLGVADTGESWTDTFGNWTVESNRARQNVTSISGGEVQQRITTLPAVSNGIITVIVSSLEDLTGIAGVVFRYVDGNNHWRAIISRESFVADPIFRFDKVVAGVYTEMSFTSVVAHAGDQISARFVGSTIQLLGNGVVLGEEIDSTFVSATRIGMTISPSNYVYTMGVGRLDDFSFDEL